MVSKKAWRSNCIVKYADKRSVHLFREPVLLLLKSFALDTGIECAISYEHVFAGDSPTRTDTRIPVAVFDLVY